MPAPGTLTAYGQDLVPALPRYRFIAGLGDTTQEALLQQASDQGYEAKLMIFDESAVGENRQIVVLMERTIEIGI